MTTTETRTFWFPTACLASLDARLEKLAKKAAKLGCPAPSYKVVATKVLNELNPEKETEHFSELEFCGTKVVIAGWEFLASIEHTENGNVIRNITSEELSPEWRTTSATRCDHCNTARRRNNTFVVREQATGKEMQVGRSCLKDFVMGHGSAENAALMAYWAMEVLEATDSENYGGGGEVAAEVPEFFLAQVAACIREFGWVPRSYTYGEPTANVAWNQCFPPKNKKDWTPVPVTAADKATGAAAMAWVLEVDTGNDYLHNINVVAQKACWVWKDIGMAASIVSSYQRTLVKAAEKKAREEAKPKVDEAEAAEAMKAVASENRAEITGTILTTKWQENQYGETQKMLVLDDRGFKVWGSVPRSLSEEDELRGMRVTFAAAVERSHDDRVFGFFKRPTKATASAAA